MYGLDVDYKREESRDIFGGNFSKLQNEGNQMQDILCPEGDLYFPGTAYAEKEQFWEKTRWVGTLVVYMSTPKQS